MLTNRLARLESRILNTPLMIEPSAGEVVLHALAPRIGLDVSAFSDRDEVERREARSYKVVDRIAIIPVIGETVRRSSWVDAMSGLTSYAKISDQFHKALKDSAVDAVLFEIDSPGGEAGGTFDLVDQIYRARGNKPIWASVNESACSAAYAIASACDHITLSRTGRVGSVGVVAYHVDKSKADEKAGLTYTPLYAGEKKIQGNPHEPLTEEAKTSIMEDINGIYDLFVNTVARNRGLSEQAVRETQAGIFMGEKALASGFADEVATFEEAFSKLSARLYEESEDENESERERGFSMSEENKEIVMEETVQVVDEPDSAVTPEAAAEEHYAYMQSVLTACTNAGMPELALEYVKEKMDLEDVQKSLESRGEIASMIAAAQRRDSSLTAEVAKSIMAKASGSVDTARKLLFDRLVAQDEAIEIDTSTAAGPATVEGDIVDSSTLYATWQERRKTK